MRMEQLQNFEKVTWEAVISRHLRGFATHLQQLHNFQKVARDGTVLAHHLRGFVAQDLLPVSEEDFHGPGLQLGKVVLERSVEVLQTVALPELKRKEKLNLMGTQQPTSSL